MKLIVGLGNPGNEYADTRHNIGFMAVDTIAEKHTIALQKKQFRSVFGSGFIAKHKTILLKPLTFMNCSGEAVRAVADYYEIEAEDILVIHDDMDIPFGQLKIKLQGGSAGHRGIESITRHLHAESYPRIRVGVGKPPEHTKPTDFVLQKFRQQEETVVESILSTINDCIEIILDQGPQAAMNRFHSIDLMVQ